MTIRMRHLKDRLTEDSRPLHRTPFMLLWMGATAIAWFVVLMVFVIADDIYGRIDNTLAIVVVSALLFGTVLSLVQGWAVRQRYGFIPRFWRAGTLLGMLLGSSWYFSALYKVQDFTLSQMTFWFVVLAFAQMLVLWRVNCQAWLLMIVAGLASISAGLVFFFELTAYSTEEFAMLIGTLVYIFGTGIVMLRIMATPREGSVPKRENSKAELRRGHRLHPMPFMLLWMSAFVVSWVILFSVASLYYDIFDPFYHSIEDWLWDWGMHWLSLPLIGLLFGWVVAIGQKWLIERKSGRVFERWILISTLAWGVAAIAFWEYVNDYPNSLTEFAMLALWLGLPIVVQGLMLWRQIRGAWVYALAGVVAGGLGVYITIQTGDTSNYTFYGFIFGAIVQAMLSGAAFVMLQAQTEQLAVVDA